MAADRENAVGAERVLAVLMSLAEKPEGTTLIELADELQSSKPTIHRALSTLRKLGLANQLSRGEYILGDEFLRLAFLHHDRRPDTARVTPILQELADEFGETSHYAVLDGSEVVYRAKIDPPAGAIRLTSAVGGRNPAYRTAVGKVLLAAQLRDRSAVDEWVAANPLERRTEKTITTAAALHQALQETRERGFAIDDQENETGVNCVALAIHFDSPSVPTGAVSVSGLTYRTPLAKLVDAVPHIREIISTRG